MTTSSTGPLIPRRRLGAAFRELREGRGETLQQTAKALMFSPSKLSRIENGLAGEPHPRDVRDIIAHFGVDDTDAATLEQIADDGRIPGWWQVPPYTMPRRVDTYISYESSAAHIAVYAPNYVPGLLQTRGYASGVLTRLAHWLDADAVSAQVDIRMRRQDEHRRRDPQPRTLYAVSEAVLRRGTGTPEVMRCQLDALIEASRNPTIELHILPFSTGLHHATELSTTTVFTFDDVDDLDVVAIERDTSVQFLEKTDNVRHYRDVIARLADFWLDPADSRAFVDDMKNQLWQEKK
jgi:transcriptional regulator with XRE-family HTH domain